MSTRPDSPVERVRALVSRAGLVVIAVLLAVGLSFSAAGDAETSTSLLRIACGLLVAMPIVSVLALTAEEIRVRDWFFVATCVAVVALIAIGVWERWR
jgi:hypothetical protein